MEWGHSHISFLCAGMHGSHANELWWHEAIRDQCSTPILPH